MRGWILLLACAAVAETPRKGASYLSSSDETIPQIIFGGEWSTKLTFTNLRSTTVDVPVAFYGADGRALAVPFIGRPTGTSQRVTIPAGGQVTLETQSTSNSSTTGWGEADIPCTGSSDSCGQVAIMSTLRNRNSTRPDFEAVFHARSSGDKAILPIDNSAGHSTVLMIVNDSSFRTETITVAFRDQSGARVHLDQFTLPIRGTILVNVAEKWPVAASLIGTADFTAQNSSMVLTALRINPTNSFTPIEAFEPL